MKIRPWMLLLLLLLTHPVSAQISKTQLDLQIARLEKEYFKSYDSLSINLTVAKNYLNQAARMHHTDGELRLNYLIGKIYLQLNNTISAIPFLYKSMKLCKNSNNLHYLNKNLMQMAIITYSLKKHKESSAYLNTIISKSRNDSIWKNDATIYYLSALNYIELHKFDSAITHLYKSKQLAHFKQNFKKLAESQTYLGKVFIELRKADSANIYLTLAETFFEKQPNHEDALAVIYHLRSKLAELQKQEKDRIRFLLFALEKANISRYLEEQVEINFDLARYYKNTGDYALENQYLKSYYDGRDSVQSHDVAINIALGNAQSDYEQKEQILHAEIIQKENQRNTILVFLFCTLAGIGIMVFLYRIVRKERKKSDTLLLNILPKHVAEELKEHGKTTARLHNDVMIVFTDFVSFTSKASALSPQELVEIIDGYFSEFDRIFKNNKIEKIKTIGDAYMGVGGLNKVDVKYKYNTIIAALQMLEYVEKVNPFFKIRIGIHLGNVVAGVVGEDKFAYDIWGDDVNIAARLESNSLPQKINISKAVYDSIRNEFNCEHRGKIEVKNKGELEMYFLVGKKAEFEND